MTKVMTKSTKVNERMSSKCSRWNQEQFKTQEEKLKNTSRFKKKDKFKNQDSRIKLQESRSRFKNQEKT